MKLAIHATAMLLFSFAAFSVAHAQGEASARELLQLSAFGGMTGTYTGLSGGRNLGITAGVDLGFGSYFGLQPSIEARGTYPFDKGQVDGQKDALGGLKIEKRYGRVHPYIDFLAGRGEIKYQGIGYPGLDNRTYQETPSTVYSPGAGVDFDLGDQFAIKADVQFQRYDTPVTPSGSLYAKPITLGVIYRFNFNRHGPRQ